MTNPIIDYIQSPFNPSENHEEPLINGTINSAFVTQAFHDCLFGPEIKSEANLPPDAVQVDGIMSNFALNKAKLESHRKEIESLLPLIPNEFKVSGGGGMSFLNLCYDVNNHQWTSFHLVMEQLLVLAIGLGLATILLPRPFWSALPGGMPYVSFHELNEKPITFAIK